MTYQEAAVKIAEITADAYIHSQYINNVTAGICFISVFGMACLTFCYYVRKANQ